MESRDEPQPNPALSREAQDALGSELQDMLVELVDLGLVGKQLAWSALGPEAGWLHSDLDELVRGWRGFADLIASRIRAVGCWPDGQAITLFQVTEGWGLEPVSVGATSCAEVVETLASRLTEMVMRTRARIDAIGELDISSQAVLLEVLVALERQAQELRARVPLPRSPAGNRAAGG
ncbi:MAG: ferritin-like domain-containing protein [Solirubrobacteraceae bacterium]